MQNDEFHAVLSKLPRDICDVCGNLGCPRGEDWLNSPERPLGRMIFEEECVSFTGWPGEGVFQFNERRGS
uniref:Uncharacterized protein n=1 Tax=viral metagenome TaxID=1070528 RepID=A0A6M3XYM8_9ZZZZ